ncbi:MAG: Gfo/Idh/MocA family oxidoreductase [bacterium]|nr:Gfo/Idh/MocA family oxidoreductase [bacterium]
MKSAATLAAAATTAASQERVAGANEIINLAVIGLGGNGQGHSRKLHSLRPKARDVAVGDIYKPRLERGVEMTGAKAYHDYHDLLADPSIDAVIISTPDHWHAQMAIDAMRAGKDVDVEKPMALTIDEARRMVEVAKETGRILAVDSEHTAHGIWQPARTAIQAGVLGKLLWSQTSRSRNSLEPPWNYKIEEQATPENIDWERWLGSTEKVPFSPDRFFRWRRYFEYGGGIATDLYVHHLTPLMKVTGPEFPVRAVAAGGNWFHPRNAIEVPDTFIMALDFASKHTIIVGGSLANSHELPIVVRGHEANLQFHGPDQRRPAYLTIRPEAAFVDTVRERIQKLGLEGDWQEGGAGGAGSGFRQMAVAQQEQMIANSLGEAAVKSSWETALKRSPSLAHDRASRTEFFARLFERQARRRAGQPAFRIDSPPAEDFDENFLRSIRTREKPVLDGELGYMAQVAVNMSVESYRQNKVMFFDPQSGKMTG